MTQKGFLERFCPDYKNKVGEFNRVECEIMQSDLPEEENTARKKMLDFRRVIFNECLLEAAILNFANIICKAQRKECAESASIDWIDPFDFSAGHNGIDKESILNADQPKIEEL